MYDEPPHSHPAGVERSGDARQDWTCPECHQANQGNNDRCDRCGYSLSAHRPTPGVEPLFGPHSVPVVAPAPVSTNGGQADDHGPAALDPGETSLAALVETSASPAEEPEPEPTTGDDPPTEEASEPPSLPDLPDLPALSEDGALLDQAESPTEIAPEADSPALPEATAPAPSEPTLPTTAPPAADVTEPPASNGVVATKPMASIERRQSRPRPMPAIDRPPRRPPGRLARTAPETLLLTGVVISAVAWSLIALAGASGGVGLLGAIGLGLCAVGVYVLAVGLIQAVLRRGGRRF